MTPLISAESICLILLPSVSLQKTLQISKSNNKSITVLKNTKPTLLKKSWSLVLSLIMLVLVVVFCSFEISTATPISVQRSWMELWFGIKSDICKTKCFTCICTEIWPLLISYQYACGNIAGLNRWRKLMITEMAPFNKTPYLLLEDCDQQFTVLTCLCLCCWKTTRHVLGESHLEVVFFDRGFWILSAQMSNLHPPALLTGEQR